MSKKITVSKAIGEALHEEMLRDEKVFIMGEDMAVMGNVFAITKGFLEEFGPNRVIDTPRRGLWAWPWAPRCGGCGPWWS